MMNSISLLNRADYVSLLALFFAWISILFIFHRDPYLAIIFATLAFTGDVCDGYIARKYAFNSSHGRLLDSCIDMCMYSVFSALFFVAFISPHIIASVIVGFSIIACGILRLVRFVGEGILSDSNDHYYYRGVTTVHMCFAVLLVFFLLEFQNTPLMPWVVSLVLLLISFAQLSNIKSYKPTGFTFYVLIVGITITAVIYINHLFK